jgi:hypothetical protein
MSWSVRSSRVVSGFTRNCVINADRTILTYLVCDCSKFPEIVMTQNYQNTIRMKLLIAVLIVLILLGCMFSMRNPVPQKASPKAFPKPYYGVVENFNSADLPIGGGDSPALDSPRTPYTLLNGALKPVIGERAPLTTSRSCAATDWNYYHSLTGNFSKFTNNNMPTYPDNCTGPLQEFTLSFYKTDAAGEATA